MTTRRAVAALFCAVCATCAPTTVAALAPTLPVLEQTARAHHFDLAAGAKEYPADDALLLLHRREVVLDDRGFQTRRTHRVLKVLRGDAARLANVRFVMPQARDFDLVGRTVSPTGAVHWLAGSDVHREVLRSRDPLLGTAEVVAFAFPDVEPGAILEWAMTATHESEMLADVALLDDDVPVVAAEYALGYPQGRAFRVYVEAPRGGTAAPPVRRIATDAFGRPQTLEEYALRDLAALPRGEAPDVDARARVLVVATAASTAANPAATGGAEDPWARFSGRLLRSQETLLEDLETHRLALQHRLLDIATPEDRARTVLAQLQQRLRLETGHPVSERWRTLTEILESGVAEPGEFCSILAALLREAGLQAHLALVNGQGALRLDRRVPWGGFFDRLLVVVVAAGRTLYFDPLSPDMSAGVARADCQGRVMLIARLPGGRPHMSNVRAETAETVFVQIPWTAAEDNGATRKARVALDREGLATVALDEERRGEAAFELGDLVRSAGAEPVRRAIAAQLLDPLPDADPGSVQLTSGGRRTMAARAAVRSRALALDLGDGRFALDLRALARADVLDEALRGAASARHGRVSFRYPQVVRVETDVTLPRGQRLVSLPPAATTLEGPGVRWTATVRRTPAGFLRVTQLTITDPIVDDDALAALVEFGRRVARADAEAALVETGAP